MRASLLLFLALACSSNEGTTETPAPATTAESPEAEPEEATAEGADSEDGTDSEGLAELTPELDPGERTLDPATGFDAGCSTDADCVIATDPCARAFAVHRDRQEAFQDQFAGRRYRCAMQEYPSDPVAYCRESRCVGVVP